MWKIILELLLALIPTIYGGNLLIKANKIKSYESEEEKDIVNKRINRMRRSGNMFLIVGLYLLYQFYKLHFA